MSIYTISARNINDAYRRGVTLFALGNMADGHMRRRVARDGKATQEYNGIVLTHYSNPRERVLFDPVRNANPFFHFFEALWILAGRNDVAWLAHYLPRMAEFSDDGETFHGAYGQRLRCTGKNLIQAFAHDQLLWVVEHLHANPDSRRAVATIFHGWRDHTDSKDIPCNTTLAFAIRDGKLDLTVFNRSNDMVWGAYGANVVQFSTILEFVAGCLHVPVGSYTQISNNFHVYEEEKTWLRVRDNFFSPGRNGAYDPYTVADVNVGGVDIPGTVHPYGMMEPYYIHTMRFTAWLEGLQEFMLTSEAAATDEELIECHLDAAPPFFNDVCRPLFNAFQLYKAGELVEALEAVQRCEAVDWRVACTLWLNRIRAKREQA